MTSILDGPGKAAAPDPEVTAKAKRRVFTAEYKARILREAEALAETGGVGEMLRREGLYSSHLTSWRRALERGGVEGLTAKKRGRKGVPNRELLDENGRLQRENARLRKQLAQAEAIIDVQKKVSLLLSIPEKDPDADGSDS